MRDLIVSLAIGLSLALGIVWLCAACEEPPRMTRETALMAARTWLDQHRMQNALVTCFQRTSLSRWQCDVKEEGLQPFRLECWGSDGCYLPEVEAK